MVVVVRVGAVVGGAVAVMGAVVRTAESRVAERRSRGRRRRRRRAAARAMMARAVGARVLVKSDVVATVAVVRAAAALVLPFADLTTKRTFYQFANWVRSQRFRFVNRACVAYSLQTGRLKRPVCRLRVSVCSLSRRRLRRTNSREGTHQGAIP